MLRKLVAILTFALCVVAIWLTLSQPNTAFAQNPTPSIVQATVDPPWKPGDPFEAPMPQFAPPGESFATGPTMIEKMGVVVLIVLFALLVVTPWTWYMFWIEDALGFRERYNRSRKQSKALIDKS